MTKLFDSLANLKFEEDDKGNKLKSATGMHSKDGEYVDMDKACDLNGQVSKTGLSPLFSIELLFISTKMVVKVLYTVKPALVTTSVQQCIV